MAGLRWIALFAFAAAACSGGGSGADGGPACQGVICDQPPPDRCRDASTLVVYARTGECDPSSGQCSYAAHEQACPHGCEGGRCKPWASGELELYIPEGTRLCSIWGWGGDSVMYNWEGKARVGLNPGAIVFPEDLDEVEADPIASLEVWPGVSAEPLGSSAFVRSIEQVDEIEVHVYELVQSFSAEERAIDVVLRVTYEIEAGEALRPVLVLDDSTLFDWIGYAGTYVEDWKRVSLVSCHFEHLEERVRELQVDNGDRLTFSLRGREEEFTWPEPSMVFNFELVQTILDRGGQQRAVSDFFDLASNMNHHGCCPSYLTRFGEPLGGVSLIWIDEFSYGQTVHYLDADGQEIESAAYALTR
ncbi:MAG: hypothetical protein JXR96_22350 [Deltaproteobacteria bacterium]|nr:hypothetical protein [Deltaproteobacteria bacterium]